MNILISNYYNNNNDNGLHGKCTLYASLMELNLASASALLEGFLSGCHLTTRDLYALPMSERDADFGIPRMLYKFFGDCDLETSPISKTREKEKDRKKKGKKERKKERKLR